MCTYIYIYICMCIYIYIQFMKFVYIYINIYISYIIYIIYISYMPQITVYIYTLFLSCAVLRVHHLAPVRADSSLSSLLSTCFPWPSLLRLRAHFQDLVELPSEHTWHFITSKQTQNKLSCLKMSKPSA